MNYFGRLFGSGSEGGSPLAPLEFQAAKAGTLPGPSEAVAGEVRLPPGRLISPAADFSTQKAAAEASPVLWLADGPSGNVEPLWSKIAAGFKTHGLWPLSLQSLDGDKPDGRPWECGELNPAESTSPDRHEAQVVLARWWRQCIPSGEEADPESPPALDLHTMAANWKGNVAPVVEEDNEALEIIAPLGTGFPGLAPASQSPVRPDALKHAIAGLPGRLGLVAVQRPADVLAAVGWMGTANHFGDQGLLSAVLRSWEDRFEAFLVGVGFDTITLAVRHPPVTEEHAIAVAAEHMAACPDNIYQGAGSIKAYAKDLVGQQVWAFWWD